MRFFSTLRDSIGDLWRQKVPPHTTMPYRFGFLVHPRGTKDVYRKYPFFRLFPVVVLELFLRMYWPVTVSRITGLRSSQGEIDGFIFSIPLTAKQMIEHRQLAQKKIKQALRLATHRGVQLIGLGGLTSSLTGGGIVLLDGASLAITTGHAYTAYNVTANLFALAKRYQIDPRKARVAIVGAAGSIGSTSALILARAGYTQLLLIDLARKHGKFEALTKQLVALNGEMELSYSHQVQDIKTSDFIIAATNAPEALITTSDLKPGAIVIDDAQPSDVSPEVFDRDDVLAIEAGVVHTPNILSNFNLGLKHRQDNFCCMAEVLILAKEQRNAHYVIERPTLALVDEIGEKGKAMGFEIARFQNSKELIEDAKLVAVGTHIARNGIQY
jgi:predicted amino acid dehydrogenase